ncbi:alkaline phosphatase-like isoform X2 [Patiria miniata]|nr:alkaline phosphatase-like isoform X2 [Patiria miniata]XP_038068806.1 alkaline phosphatase-like isoform X2 [Patiria miniata]
MADGELTAAINEAKGLNTNTAGGTILFIGDGMSVSTVTGVRIWKGQSEGKTGEESVLEYDKFPHFGYSKTFNTNSQVPDSAGTATAYLTGVKTKRRVLGLDAGINVGDCASTFGHELDSILVRAKNSGLPVGIITTTRLTHASPAGAYAHVPERDWEADSGLTPEAEANGCRDIAWQLMHGPVIDVIMGGGRMYFRTPDIPDEEEGTGGIRNQGDLIQDWKDRYGKMGSAEYIVSKSQLDALDTDDTDFLLGLFDRNHLNFGLDSADDILGNPTLAEMTEAAIKILKRKGNGRYFLFVEGGRVDHGEHINNGKKAIDDGLALEKAIAKAKEITDDNTLIVLSSDHAHTMTIQGYPERGHSLFGKVNSDDVGLPYTTIGFYTGPEAFSVQARLRELKKRPDLTNIDTDNKEYTQQAFVATFYETHGGEDVAIFATGPWSHLFHSVHEQNYIPHVMMFAGCFGDYQTSCRDSPYLDAARPGRIRGKSAGQPTQIAPEGTSAAYAQTPSWPTVLVVLLLAKLNQVL